ncbi:MAG: hypothetical protein JXA71_01965, partial [Chitinispirillaceae bacterium]|nr:hypothetical protein [Chitinispirillaceae bacterium]
MAADEPSVPAGQEPPVQALVFRMEPEYYIGTYLLILLFFGLLVVAYLPLLFSYLVDGTVYLPLQRAAMYLSGTYFLLLLTARFGRNEMNRVRFAISDRSLSSTSMFRTTEIPFPAILRCSVHTFPLIKGYVRICAADRRITLPSTIHRFTEMVEELIKRMAASGRGDLLDTKTVNDFRRIACIAAFSQARSRAAFFPLVYGTLVSALVNAGVAGVMWRVTDLPLAAWIAAGLFIPLLIYGTTDFRLNQTLDRQLKRDPAALPELSLRG